VNEPAGAERLSNEQTYHLAMAVAGVADNPTQTIAGHPIGDVTVLTDDQLSVAPLDELGPLLERLRALEDQIRIWQAEATDIKAALQERLGTAEVGTVGGKPQVTWKHHLRSALDTTLLKQQRPDLYAAFLRTTTVRRFVILGEEE
jgi:hypothetical protein